MKNSSSKRWIHPVHAKGVASQSLGGASAGGKLTDRKIEQYIREGRYGETARKRLLMKEETKRQRKVSRKASKINKQANLQKLLDEIGLN